VSKVIRVDPDVYRLLLAARRPSERNFDGAIRRAFSRCCCLDPITQRDALCPIHGGVANPAAEEE
jgi:hypothetical protein